MLKINKSKSIGRVLYIVEGSRTEFSILRKIFCNILGYEYIEKRRNKSNPYTFISKNNAFSKVAVINTRESNITDITNNSDYLEELYEMLIDKYEFPINQAAIFYLFDRDPLSNTKPEYIKELINQLRNPYDNGINQAGMLLLSYPSIEAYTISLFDENANKLTFNLGKDCKDYIGNNAKTIQLNKFDEEAMITAAGAFIASLEGYNIEEFLDDFSSISQEIFDEQEIRYLKGDGFKLFSMLSLSFLQLGILTIE